MSAVRGKYRSGLGAGSGAWPVLLALLMVVLPTACVLWFLNEAVQNERLATRQRLLQAYRGQLPALHDRLDAYWRKQSEAMRATVARHSAAEVFAACIANGLADGVVIYDGAGQIAYPDLPIEPVENLDKDDAWREASRLEYVDEDPAAAAAAYADIANTTTDNRSTDHAQQRQTLQQCLALKAQALQAQARCLVKAGRSSEAVRMLVDELGQDKYANVCDERGRLIAADTTLRALQLLGNRQSGDYTETVDRLSLMLADYSNSPLPSAQRRFLMKELVKLIDVREGSDTAAKGFPRGCRAPVGRPGITTYAEISNNAAAALLLTLPAEELAAQYIESRRAAADSLMKKLSQFRAGAMMFPVLSNKELFAVRVESRQSAADAGLRPSGLSGVWQFASSDGRIVGLLREASVKQRVATLLAHQQFPPNVCIDIAPPDVVIADGVEHILDAGDSMPGWRLTMALADGEHSGAAGDYRIAVNTWIAVLVIAAMTIVVVFVAAVFRRQMRLARLKNDLLATVSHELKTPLTSVRLLVDTLLDAERPDSPKGRGYLRLISKENARLSHLIDNFLSFSRLERGKQSFEFADVRADEIAQRAEEVVAERFTEPDCSLRVDSAADLPVFQADADALLTAVINLLDNAYKYTGKYKQVELRTYAENGSVCFAVADNGIGLAPRAAKAAFRPFYQVDRRLSRSCGGCGLGLSIVQFIAEAHGGTVRVASRPGEGSTFTLSIPQNSHIE